MKLFLCIAFILVAGASAFPSLSAKPSAVSMVNPAVLKHMQKFQYIADNFESWTPRKQVENINDLVDLIIVECRHFLVTYHFDPMNMPVIDESVDLAGTTIQLKLSEGVVSNASSIYRNGDVQLGYANRLLTVNVPIFFKVLHMDYKYDILVGEDQTHLDGKLNGQVIVVDVNFEVQVDFSELNIKLTFFEIATIGAIDIKFVGGMLEWLLQGLTEYITGQFKTEVVQVVEAICEFTLNGIFDIINQILGSIKP